MASSSQETDEFPSFSPTTPHFVRIISEGTSAARKLRVPKPFVIKYGDGLSNLVCLKLPSGQEWKVELRRWDGEAWFDKGWPEFSRFYSLDCGHSLVFQYEGNSKFRVCIFDSSGTEIDYPLRTPKMKENVVILENSPPGNPRKARWKSPLPCSRPHRKDNASSSGKDHLPTKRSDVGMSSTPRFREQTHRPLPKVGKTIALERANAFKSQRPSSALVSMNSTYIHRAFMWLPVQLHHKKDCGKVILRVSNRGTWRVHFKFERRRTNLRRGWLNFVHENSLKVDDVCVFVPINNSKGKPVFDVAIFRTTESRICSKNVPVMEETDGIADDDDPVDVSSVDDSGDNADYGSDDSDNDSGEAIGKFSSCPRKKRGKTPLLSRQAHKKNRTNPSGQVDFFASGKAKALERADAFKSEYPFFKLTMTKTYIYEHYMYLASQFVNKHLLSKTHGHAILRIPNGRTWTVILEQGSNGRTKFHSGWMIFVRDNNLKIDDVCVFMLIDISDEPLFDVVVFHATEAAKIERGAC